MLRLFVLSSKCSEQLRHNHNIMRTWLKVNMKLIGLFLFFLAFVFLELTEFIANSFCFSPLLTHCKDSFVYSVRSLDMFSNLINIVFICIAVALCYKFRARRFVRRTGTLISFGWIGSTTLAMWVDDISYESQPSNITEYMPTEDCSGQANSSATISNLQLSECVSKNTALFIFLKHWHYFLYPCAIEFLLMFAEFLAGWFFGSLNDASTPRGSGVTDDLEHVNTNDNTVAELRNGNGISDPAMILQDEDGEYNASPQVLGREGNGRVPPSFQGSNVTRLGETADISLANENGLGGFSESGALVEHDANVNGGCGENVSHNQTMKALVALFALLPCNVIIVMLLIIGNFMFIITAILQDHADIYYTKCIYGYRILYWITLSAFNVIGYTFTRQFYRTAAAAMFSRPVGSDYFVIFTSFGPIFKCTSLVTASDLIVAFQPITYVLFLTEAVLNLVQVIIQTLIYFYVKGVIKEDRGEQRQHTFRSRLHLLKAVLISLIIGHLTLWAMSSFNDTDKTSDKPPSYGWSIIFRILSPLNLMYRFNCFIMFTECLRELI